ncbi:unnamed protein product [Arctogadus glacialis]
MRRRVEKIEGREKDVKKIGRRGRRKKGKSERGGEEKEKRKKRNELRRPQCGALLWPSPPAFITRTYTVHTHSPHPPSPYTVHTQSPSGLPPPVSHSPSPGCLQPSSAPPELHCLASGGAPLRSSRARLLSLNAWLSPHLSSWPPC